MLLTHWADSNWLYYEFISYDAVSLLALCYLYQYILFDSEEFVFKIWFALLSNCDFFLKL